MKPISNLLLICLLSIGITSILPAQNDTWKSQDFEKAGWKRYQVKSAKITYKVSGSISGSETISFDRWGWREAKLSQQTISMMGFTQKEDKTYYIDGEVSTGVDNATQTGTQTLNPLFTDLRKQDKHTDLTYIGEEMLISMGGKKTGTAELLGKTCDVWEIPSMGTKSLVWEGITLKSETNFLGQNVVVEAEKIEVNLSIPEDQLVLPSTITIKEVPSFNGWGTGMGN